MRICRGGQKYGRRAYVGRCIQRGDSTPPWRFDYQGLTSGSLGTGWGLTLSGTVAPAPPMTYYWMLSGGGTIPSEERTSQSPTHNPPASAGGGTLKLEAKHNGSPTGAEDTQSVTISESHLDRDMENEGDLESHSLSNDANCTASAYHAWNGTAPNYSPRCPWGGTGTAIFDVTDEDMNEYDEIDFSVVNKHDCVLYYREISGVTYALHVETFVDDNVDATWGANTPSDPGAGQWSNSTVEDYINEYENVVLIELYAY